MDRSDRAIPPPAPQLRTLLQQPRCCGILYCAIYRVRTCTCVYVYVSVKYSLRLHICCARNSSKLHLKWPLILTQRHGARSTLVSNIWIYQVSGEYLFFLDNKFPQNITYRHVMRRCKSSCILA